MRVPTRVAGVVLVLIGIMEMSDSLAIESRWSYLVLATGLFSVGVGFLVDSFTRHSKQFKMLKRVGLLCLICAVMQAFARPFYPFLQEGAAFVGVILAYILSIVLMLCLHINYPEEELAEALKKASEKHKAKKAMKDKRADKK